MFARIALIIKSGALMASRKVPNIAVTKDAAPCLLALYR